MLFRIVSVALSLETPGTFVHVLMSEQGETWVANTNYLHRKTLGAKIAINPEGESPWSFEALGFEKAVLGGPASQSAVAVIWGPAPVEAKKE